MQSVYFSGATDNPALSFGKCRGLVRRELAEIGNLVDERLAGLREVIQIYLGIPLWCQRSKWKPPVSSRFIWFTMWEWPEIPKAQIDRINATQGLITPATWTDRIAADAGVDVPRFIVPFGVDPAVYNFQPKPRTKEDPFTFLWIGYQTGHVDAIRRGDRKIGDRKRGWLVRQAFEELDFGPEARLILKSVPYPAAPMNMHHRTPAGSDIHEYSLWVSEAEMVRLYRDADVMVWPTYGEGFGLPPLEAAACGTPTILPNYSAVEDYFDDDWLIQLPHQVGEIWPEAHDKMTGACVSIEELKAAMEYAFENRQDLQRMGEVGAAAVSESWTYEKATRPALRAVLDHYESEGL